MYAQLRLFLLGGIFLFAFSACNNLPKHAQYIPGDAVVVVGINTKEMGKQIAWNALIGSKLFDELKAGMSQKGVMEGLGDAGIKHMSTSYLYVKNDEHHNEGVRITALVPLDDASKWEAYVKRTFPDANVTIKNDRKEAKLVNGMYAGWTKDLLIIMNIVKKPKANIGLSSSDSSIINSDPSADSLTSADSYSVESDTDSGFVIDSALLSSEMALAFTPEKNNRLTDDSRFKKMETKGHDITLWVNYDVLMSQNSDKIGMPSELALGSTFWKDAALSAGFDFEKGKIAGDMLYYTSESLKEVAKELGGKNVDKELLDRLPDNDLDMLVACHLSTKGLKMLFEKIGVLGFANLALSSEGLNTEDIFDAFSGDIGITINNLKTTYTSSKYPISDSAGKNITAGSNQMNFLYVMKIANREKFNKLLMWLNNKEVLKRVGNNLYTSSISDSIFMANDNHYMAISNTVGQAQHFLSGKFSGNATPSIVKQDVYGHPLGMYVNFQQILNAVQLTPGTEADDIVALTESKKLLDNFVFSGGDYTNNAFSYHAELNFVNKDENSIFQIMNFALKLNEAGQAKPHPSKSPI